MDPESQPNSNTGTGDIDLRGIVLQVLLLVVITVAFLGVLEGGARLLGVGKEDPDSSVLFYQQINLPLFKEVALADGQKVFRAADERLGFQQFSAKKDANTFRVFVFGGSATNGLGYSKNLTFSNFLREYLQNIYPGQNFEVLNCGIIGFSTKQVRALVDHVRQSYEPDLLVVYEANNEFLELHARMFADRHLNARVLQVQDVLHRSHLYRALRAGIRKMETRNPVAQHNTEEQLAKFAFSETEIMANVKVSPAEYAFVEKKLKQNIRDIAQSARGTPLVLMTVASNLRWNDPDDQRSDWLRNYLQDHGVSVANANSDLVTRQSMLLKALTLLQREAASKRPDYSNDADAVHFRLGKVYEELGNPQRAKQEYVWARDLDPKSRRAISQFNRAIMDLGARRKAYPGLQVLDTEEFLAGSAPKGIIGNEMFYDYVHFTPLGAQRVAEALARRIVEEQLLAKSNRGPQPFDYNAFVASYAEDLRKRTLDYPEMTRWIGFNFDKSMIGAVNLFKYNEGVKSLRNMAALGRRDPWIYAFLGNADALALGKDTEAEKNYREALRLLSDRDDELRRALLGNLSALYQRRGENDQVKQVLTLVDGMRRGRSGERAALDKFLRGR